METSNPNPEIRYCENPKCKKVLTHLGRSKYCSEVCRTRHCAMRQYSKLKDNEEFKQYRKLKNKKYYEDNKEELKTKMRIYGMQYFFRKRDEKRKQLEEQKQNEQNKTEQTINQTNNSQ